MGKISLAVLIASFYITAVSAQEAPLDMKMDFESYDPPS
jgi:hypothetical protein